MLPLDPDTFRQIVEALPVGVYVVGLDRRISYWNKAAEQITGYLSQEVIGRPCHADPIAHCGARDAPVCVSAGCLLTCSLRDGKQIEAVLFGRHKDGHCIPLQVRSFPICNAEGRIVAIAELFQQQSFQSDMRWTSQVAASADGLEGPSVLATEAYLNLKLKSPEGLAIFVVELQDKEAMAKQRGWEMVHSMTRTMVNTITDLLPMPYFLGRWHGDRFLIAVPRSSEQSFQELMGQLEHIDNLCSVTWWGDQVAAHVFVRGVLLHAGDSMESLLTKIDPVREPECSSR